MVQNGNGIWDPTHWSTSSLKNSCHRCLGTKLIDKNLRGYLGRRKLFRKFQTFLEQFFDGDFQFDPIAAFQMDVCTVIPDKPSFQFVAGFAFPNHETIWARPGNLRFLWDVGKSRCLKRFVQLAIGYDL